MLKVVHNSLADLQKAIKGTVVMSETLEGVHTAFLSNTVNSLYKLFFHKKKKKSLQQFVRSKRFMLLFVPGTKTVVKIFVPFAEIIGQLDQGSGAENRLHHGVLVIFDEDN